MSCACGCGQEPKTPGAQFAHGHHFRKYDSVEEQFWANVEKTEDCWLWKASTFADSGYGQMRVGKKMRRAHRVGYEIQAGPIPEGLAVLHRCDEPRCVRGSHLFLGTHKENMADMVAKGRSASRANGRHWRTT